MNELNENLKQQIQALISKAWQDTTLSADERISLHLQAWELLPQSNKLSFSESFDIASWLLSVYMHLKNYDEAKKWGELFLHCYPGRCWGEQEKAYAKLAYELGNFEVALDYFVIASVKGGGLRWGSNDKHYKQFFTNAPGKDAKIAAYKQSLKPKKVAPAKSDVPIESVASNPLTKKFYDDKAGKIHYILHEGKLVKEESGKPEKTKISEKEFPDNGGAGTHALKKETELLRKGFVYRNEQAEIGKPIMHYFLKRLYTGALAFESTPRGIYVSGVGEEKKNEEDYLDLIDERGILQETFELPRMLPWQMKYNPHTELLYLYLDKCLYEYTLSTGEMKTLTDPNPREFSNKSFAFAGDVLAFTLKETIELTLNAKTASEGKFDLSFPRSNESVALALSKNGKIFAMLNEPDIIKLIDTSTGNTISELQVNTKVIENLQFIQNDTILVFRDMNDYWKLRFFDLESKQELFFEDLAVKPHSYTFGFAFNADESKLAVTHGYNVIMYDFNSKQKIHEFNFEHCHKKAEIKFVNDLLGARTDMGCFTLYKV